MSLLACQLSPTPLPPPPSPTVRPLPTVALPTLVTPTATPLAVATSAPTATAPEATRSKGTISGWVWHDLCDPGPEGGSAPTAPPAGCVADPFGVYRADGLREAHEPALGGVVVRLGAGACPSIGLAESATASIGPSYAFDGLESGAYCVSVDPFAEPNRSNLLPGKWTYPGTADGLLGQTVTLAPGQSLPDISFGWDYQFLPVATTPTATSTQPVLASPSATSALLRTGSTFHAQRVATPPTLDGNVGEWPALPSGITTAAFRPENWTGVNDQSASFAVGWDDQNLYLAVRLVDDVHVQTQSGETIFRGDSLELLLDADLNGDFARTVLDGDDYQLGLTPGSDRATPDAFLWFSTEKEGRPAGVVVATQPDSAGHGYFLEVAIPWALFAVAPAAGDHFGFALSSSDNDTPGTAEQQSMISTEAGRRLTNPTTWGTLILDP